LPAREFRPIVLLAERLQDDAQSSARQIAMAAKGGDELLGRLRRAHERL
jgi:hypothetical protein